LSAANLQPMRITIADQVYPIPQGVPLLALLESLPPSPLPILAARVNGELHELTYPLYADSTVEWLDLSSDTGLRIYKRSLRLVLLMAAGKLFPERQLKIEHSINNGTYCELRGESPLSEEEISRLGEEMRQVVQADLPIIRREVTKSDAIRYFASQGREEKAQLLDYRPGDKVKLYSCGAVTDYFFGYMAPSTGCLGFFQLQSFNRGFLLIVPERKNPTVFISQPTPHKFAAVFADAQRIGELTGLENIAQLNQLIKSGRQDEVIQVAETLHERTLIKTADAISADRQVKLVLIAGPSSSGKTTFAQRLSIQFRANGIKPLAVSMDDYFINRDDTPLDPNGEPDFENINALDLELFNRHLESLIAGEEVLTPRYDFKTGMRQPEGQRLHLEPNQILIVEGIHGLNEMLTAAIPGHTKRKIYVSALTQLNVDDYAPISSSDSRLIRRMARDLQFRGISVQETLRRWPRVREGEEKYIFPFQEDADFIFNSALVYELAVLKGRVLEELKNIPPLTGEKMEAKRLASLLQYVLPASTDQVPIHSILREFLGGGCFMPS